MNDKVIIDTSSLEYVKEMAAVWKANDERNKKLAEQSELLLI